jgi:hypothetical protein
VLAEMLRGQPENLENCQVVSSTSR